jgi:hypothetical protein
VGGSAAELRQNSESHVDYELGGVRAGAQRRLVTPGFLETRAYSTSPWRNRIGGGDKGSGLMPRSLVTQGDGAEQGRSGSTGGQHVSMADCAQPGNGPVRHNLRTAG